MTKCNRLTSTAGIAVLVLLGSGCGQNRFQQEVETEKVAVKLARHMAEGKYEVISTAELKVLLEKKPELVLVDGWGHDLPPGSWPRLVELISTHARRVDYERQGASG